MSDERFQNNFSTTLAEAISTTDGTSASVAAGFAADGQYRVIVDSEIMIVTAGANTTTWTVTRGAEGTTAATHEGGATVTHVLTAGALGTLNRTYTSAYASPPTNPAEGDLWLPSDASGMARYNGASWDWWEHMRKVTTPPGTSDWTWVNQGNATLTASNQGVLLFKAADAANSLRILVRSTPATPYAITARIVPLMVASNYAKAGMCWRQSSDGKLTLAGYIYENFPSFKVQKWNSVSSFNSNYSDLGGPTWGGPLWIRFSDDGTIRKIFYSHDGVNFGNGILSVARTDFLTPDQIGFYVDTQNVSFGAGCALVSWEVS